MNRALSWIYFRIRPGLWVCSGALSLLLHEPCGTPETTNPDPGADSEIHIDIDIDIDIDRDKDIDVDMDIDPL